MNGHLTYYVILKEIRQAGAIIILLSDLNNKI